MIEAPTLLGTTRSTTEDCMIWLESRIESLEIKMHYFA